jgi:hypothetical protein
VASPSCSKGTKPKARRLKYERRREWSPDAARMLEPKVERERFNMPTLARNKIQAQRKLLARQLDTDEIRLILEIAKAESLVRGRLGLAEDLVRRGWLAREGNLVRLSDETRALLAEAAE